MRAHRFIGQFPGKPGLARCRLNSRSPFNFILGNLMDQAKTLHIIPLTQSHQAFTRKMAIKQKVKLVVD